MRDSLGLRGTKIGRQKKSGGTRDGNFRDVSDVSGASPRSPYTNPAVGRGTDARATKAQDKKMGKNKK